MMSRPYRIDSVAPEAVPQNRICDVLVSKRSRGCFVIITFWVLSVHYYLRSFTISLALGLLPRFVLNNNSITISFFSFFVHDAFASEDTAKCIPP